MSPSPLTYKQKGYIRLAAAFSFFPLRLGCWGPPQGPQKRKLSKTLARGMSLLTFVQSEDTTADKGWRTQGPQGSGQELGYQALQIDSSSFMNVALIVAAILLLCIYYISVNWFIKWYLYLENKSLACLELMIPLSQLLSAEITDLYHTIWLEWHVNQSNMTIYMCVYIYL